MYTDMDFVIVALQNIVWSACKNLNILKPVNIFLMDTFFFLKCSQIFVKFFHAMKTASCFAGYIFQNFEKFIYQIFFPKKRKNCSLHYKFDHVWIFFSTKAWCSSRNSGSRWPKTTHAMASVQKYIHLHHNPKVVPPCS